MSRTRKGNRGPGAEYWTARPGNKQGGQTGPITKRTTHRAERRLGKKDVNERSNDEG